MTRLDNQENSGKSVYITQKRLSYDITKDIEGATGSGKESYSVLVRVTDGNKDKTKRVKLSTEIAPNQLETFWNKYANILKSGLKGLKKKDKKKAKKRAKKIHN
ncbi:hypothetical protein KL935_004669 [Ogataea polymorpha]|nr:hypothetical protein KL937_004504 [Ogataea polymorpha]KAG7898116.1 hypothetical protein KL935_004669 [Ogataea polymorpha]KAG7932225.1 hypothetical protein KL904_004650 [Ogataea polymorpha]